MQTLKVWHLQRRRKRSKIIDATCLKKRTCYKKLHKDTVVEVQILTKFCSSQNCRGFTVTATDHNLAYAGLLVSKA